MNILNIVVSVILVVLMLLFVYILTVVVNILLSMYRFKKNLDNMTPKINAEKSFSKNNKTSINFSYLRNKYYEMFYKNFNPDKDSDFEKYIWNLDLDGFVFFIFKDSHNLVGLLNSNNINHDKVRMYLNFIDSLSESSMRYYTVTIGPNNLLAIIAVLITVAEHHYSKNLKKLASVVLKLAVCKTYDSSYYEIYGSKQSDIFAQTIGSKQITQHSFNMYHNLCNESGLTLDQCSSIVNIQFKNNNIDTEKELCYISSTELEKFCDCLGISSYHVELLSFLANKN